MKKHLSYTLKDAKKALERYCTYQERCHKDVVHKLSNMNMIPEAIDEIIYHLIQHNFLNEERFACSFVRGKFRMKKWGKLRLERELKFRQISSYNIKIAMKEIDEGEYLKTLNTIAKKKYESIQEVNVYKKKKKLCDYLFYRGWEPNLVYDLIQNF